MLCYCHYGEESEFGVYCCGLVIALFSVLEKERPPQKELNGIQWSLLIGKPLYRRFCLPASVIFHGKENL